VDFGGISLIRGVDFGRISQIREGLDWYHIIIFLQVNEINEIAKVLMRLGLEAMFEIWT
jgi:hypothetical protein